MSPFSLHRFSDATAFAAVAQPLLLREEALHSLQLGLIDGIRAGEWKDPYLAVVAPERGRLAATPVVVALRTPPHKLLLSRCEDLAALHPLVADKALAPGLPGVLGPAAVADAFADGWGRTIGVAVRPGPRQRIYRLDRLNPQSEVPGTVRLAGDCDRVLLIAWMSAFLTEALPDNRFDAADAVDRWLASQQRELYFWEVEGESVAMAGVGSPTPNGIRVSAVYTPSARRRRGYATALVAELSRRQLAAGRQFCCLFTDLANPTSNRIYRQIGYRPVGDANEYSFGARD